MDLNILNAPVNDFKEYLIFRVLDGPDVRDQQGISAYFVQMGQFIDHDITLSPELEDHVTNRPVVSVPLTSDTFHLIKF